MGKTIVSDDDLFTERPLFKLLVFPEKGEQAIFGFPLGFSVRQQCDGLQLQFLQGSSVSLLLKSLSVCWHSG